MNDWLTHFKNGGFIIVADDFSRENELDLIISCEHITENKMNQMIKWGTGIICITMPEKYSNILNLNCMVKNNNDPNQTNYTISCDSLRSKTGVSAQDRYFTAIDLLDQIENNNNKIRSPGHMFPLVCKNGLLYERRGHTEASIQLTELCGLKNVALIVELIKPDGKMLRFGDSDQIDIIKHEIKELFNEELPIITIDDIIDRTDQMNKKANMYNFKNNIIIETSSKLVCSINNKNIDYEIVVFKNQYKNIETSMIVYPSYDEFKKNLKNTHPIRIHSECLTGNIYHSLHCDCGEQLDKSMEFIYKSGGGAVIYCVEQEGRGIGLFNKIKAYNLQQTKNLDTYKANTKLGFSYDNRNYNEINNILNHLNIQTLNLISNNPDKYNSLNQIFNGKINTINLESKVNKYNENYLKAKKEYGKMIKQNNDNNVDNVEKKCYLSSITEIKLNKHKKYNVLIVSSCWNKPFIDKLKNGVNEVFNEWNQINDNQISVSEIEVPGSWEIPSMCNNILNKYKNIDIIIAIGVLIKGDTKHFEYISKSVFSGLMDLQLKHNTCVINGILTLMDIKQINERISLGKTWGLSCLKMLENSEKVI